MTGTSAGVPRLWVTVVCELDVRVVVLLALVVFVVIVVVLVLLIVVTAIVEP